MDDRFPPEALLEDYPPARAFLANGLRRIVMDAVPGAIERVRPGWRIIGYDVPVGRRTGYFAWIMTQVEHVHLGFPKGSLLDDPRGVLDGRGITKNARWFTLETPDDLANPELVAFTRAAAELAQFGRSAGPEPEITDVEAESRYEVRIDGELAGVLEYIVKRGRIALVHTEVPPAFTGRGLASKLAQFGIEDARRRGLRVIAICPTVKAYVARHPETHDIVVRA